MCQWISGSFVRQSPRIWRHSSGIKSEKWRQALSTADQVRGIKRRKLNEPFGIVGNASAQHRLLHEVDSELHRMCAGGVSYIIAKLILLLVALNRELRDRRGKLIVAKSLKSRGGVSIGAEGECQCET